MNKINFKLTKRMSVPLIGLGLMIFCSAGIFAADGLDLGALDTASDKFIKVISSKPVKVVCIAGLLSVFATCVWGQSQGEGAFIKKLFPVLYGIAGILGTVGIVNWIFSGIIVDSLGYLPQAVQTLSSVLC